MIDLSDVKKIKRDVRKKIKIPNDPTVELAEIIGIMLGDGCLHKTKKGTYQICVAFNKKETLYLNHVKNLFETYFYPYIFNINEQKDEFLLVKGSKEIGMYMKSIGLMSGNKIKNKVKIPEWIFTNHSFMVAVLRGLFDTDGCIYRKYDHYAQIQFKFGSPYILNSIKRALLYLFYNPTKIQKELNHKNFFGYKLYLSRQGEIDRFFEEIRPMNQKHVDRYNKIRNNGDAGIRTQIRWYIPK